jgi:hypothetical protein
MVITVPVETDDAAETSRVNEETRRRAEEALKRAYQWKDWMDAIQDASKVTPVKRLRWQNEKPSTR